jgi:alkylated DNA repair protein alkB homolog 6
MSFLIKSLREKIKNEKDGLQIKITRKDEKKSDFVVESTSSSSSPPPPLPEDNHHLLYNLFISPSLAPASSLFSLQDYVISPTRYPKAFYIPNSISPLHEIALLSAIDNISNKNSWIELRARRLQQWISPLPPYLERLAEDLVKLNIFEEKYKPNHILINAYEPDEGIAAHTDGPSYFPKVATLSLGSDCVMRYTVLHGREKEEEKGGITIGEVILEQRSLIITSDILYTDYGHCIPENEEVITIQRSNQWLQRQRNDTNEYAKKEEEEKEEKNVTVKRESRRVSITIRHKFQK